MVPSYCKYLWDSVDLCRFALWVVGEEDWQIFLSVVTRMHSPKSYCHLEHSKFATANLFKRWQYVRGHLSKRRWYLRLVCCFNVPCQRAKRSFVWPWFRLNSQREPPYLFTVGYEITLGLPVVLPQKRNRTLTLSKLSFTEMLQVYAYPLFWTRFLA